MQTEVRAPRLSAPRQLFFSSHRINALKRTALYLLPGTGCSYRPFARPQRFTLSRVPFQGQCSRPDTSLPYQLLPLPVRPFSSATDSGSPQNRLHPRFEPVAASSTGTTDRFYLPPLPFGTFTSLRIKAFSRSCCLPARLPNPPDFRSLPAAAFFERNFGCGSSFPFRYVSGGSLFLKPLGTSFTMLRKPNPVNRFRIVTIPFPQLLSGLVFSDLRANRMWIDCA